MRHSNARPHQLVNEEASLPHTAPLCYSFKVTPERTTLLSHYIHESFVFYLSFLFHYLTCLGPLHCSAHDPECCSDTEEDSLFRMADNRDTVTYRRSISITPKSGTSFNQFLPTKDKASGYVPAPLRRKRAEHSEDNRRSWTSFSQAEDEGTLTRYDRLHTTVNTDDAVSCHRSSIIPFIFS